EQTLKRPDGKEVWKWVHGKTLDGKAQSIKVPVKLIVCTHLPRGKKYPHCSKRQSRRYAMQEGRRLLKEYKAGKLTINEVRDGVGLPPWHTILAGSVVTDGPEKVEVKTARRVKVPVNHVICTHLNHGKKYRFAR